MGRCRYVYLLYYIFYFIIFKYLPTCRLENGGDYLFQAQDDDQMNLWVESINKQAQGQDEAAARPGKSQTLPPGSEKKDEKKGPRSFFTLKKK